MGQMDGQTMINQPARDRLNQHLDALLYVLQLNRGRSSLRSLQSIAKRRGLASSKYKLKLLRAIYEDMK